MFQEEVTVEPPSKKLCLEVEERTADVVTGNEGKKEENGSGSVDVEIHETGDDNEANSTNVDDVEEDDEVETKKVEIAERKPEDVGMTEFLGQHRGFSGTLKKRWEDFHVHEVAMNGETVRLTTTDLPLSEKVKVKVDEKVISAELKENLERLISEELPEYKFPAPVDKEERTKLHVAIKSSYMDLCANTVSEKDEKFIVIRLKSKSKDPQRSDNPRRSCQFVLHKKGRDTGEAVSVLCGLLKSHPKKFSYAGNKDRRGVSSQLVTVYQISMEQLKALNPTLRGMKVGNFEYVKKRLELGDLKGNHFSIALRDVVGEETDISNAMQSLMENGFINYFGLQRFGSGRIPSYDIGLSIIRSQWDKAIDLILEPQPTDLPKVRELKQKYKADGDASAALKGMSDHVSRGLLHGISRYGRGLKAIMELPRQLRQLYIHSTQSLLWNRLVSRRIREFGVKPQPGDLIIREECRDLRVKTKNAIVELTEENMHGVSIYDLVVPLPGYDVTFGCGKIRQWYLELLLELDLTEEQFKHEIRDFSAAGTYRAIFVRPKDISFHTRMYDDPMQTVIPSDWDLLTSRPTTTNSPVAGKHKAVVVNFTLPKSSYATVAVRELVRNVTVNK